jgi:hypothetical protein
MPNSSTIAYLHKDVVHFIMSLPMEERLAKASRRRKSVTLAQATLA